MNHFGLDKDKIPQQFYLVIIECNNTKSYVIKKERSPNLHSAIALSFLCVLCVSVVR
ncbi:hypothetical protein [Nostoc sp. UIC 10630]|uniref:hypothetical protein n=1 Tax=Nostoc sp. UIC 10630 TaxID=2100146 RepID=UPI0013D58331|nr:hypothetical protein [Nostoc sp. UIC 10630]NEU77869.1 hypothetical protein [Nostoc sp. UIC 10630]